MAEVLSATQANAIRYAAEATGADPAEVLISYSGRGMFGEQCLGLKVSFFLQACVFFNTLADADKALSSALYDDHRSESLGMGAIVYFPRYQLPDLEG